MRNLQFREYVSPFSIPLCTPFIAIKPTFLASSLTSRLLFYLILLSWVDFTLVGRLAAIAI